MGEGVRKGGQLSLSPLGKRLLNCTEFYGGWLPLTEKGVKPRE